MTGERKRYNVGAVKIPYYQRDVAHSVIQGDDIRGYRDIIGADTPDNDEKFPVGSYTTYTVELTDAEAEQFAAASNARYVEEDEFTYPQRAVGRPTGTAAVPVLSTLAYQRARYVDLNRWHGRDVRVAVLDQGTTQAVRDLMGLTLVARTVASGVPLGPGQELINIHHGHGCLVGSNAVPAGGLLLDVIISDDSGGAPYSSEAAGIRWAVDNGAKVINLSFGVLQNGDPPPQVFQDACAYARDNGNVQILIAAGNDNQPELATPSTGSRLFANVHSIIAFDPATDRRALFSNFHADGSGCSPGVDVDSFTVYGEPTLWDGTSAATPHAVHLLARALTGGQFTPSQVGQAFKNNTRDTGAGSSQQGHGAYDLHRALTSLGAVPAVTAGAVSPAHVDTRGGAGAAAAWELAPAAGVQIDDMQIVVVFAAPANDERYIPPPGWVEIANEQWGTGWERTLAYVNPVVINNNFVVRVLARAYGADQPATQQLSFLGGKWTALVFVTVRGAGGMNPERFVPQVRFGTGTSVTAVPVSPATSNDMQLCVFAQLMDTSSTTATLSLPSGFTQRGFWRPGSGTTGVAALAATRQLTDGNRTSAVVSTSNSTSGADLWCTVSMTIPGSDLEITPVVQTEPIGPPGGETPFLPRT
jgi:hypothetical protein